MLFTEKPDFEIVRKEANYFLSKQNITDIFIESKNFKLDEYNIFMDSIQHYVQIVSRPMSDFVDSAIEGCMVLKKGKINIILYDCDNAKERINHGILHEIGHICLEHTNDNKKSELEANFFASLITVPDVALWYIARYSKINISPDFINKYFNVSYQSAEKKFETFCKNYQWYSPNCYEKDIVLKLEPFLKNFINNFEVINQGRIVKKDIVNFLNI